MKRLQMGLVALFLTVAAGLPGTVSAQTGSPVRIGQDFTLRASESAEDVVVIFGSADISGHVMGDLVVILGNAQLSSTASVDGDFVVIGGSGTAAEGASVGGDTVVIGGGLEAAAGFRPGGESVVLGSTALGGRLNAFVPWMTYGLLWGRPIVPGLAWIWGIVGMFFLFYLAVNLVFDHPARACAATLADKPLTAFMVGLLVMLLVGPVCVLLAVSVIGIAVVPFVACALVVAGIVGKVGAARWIGMGIARQEPGSEESRLQSVLAFTIGFAVITVAYMIPVLGFVSWALLGVFGLGAATLAFVAAYRRENPAPPPAPRVPASVAPAAVYAEGAAPPSHEASATTAVPASMPGAPAMVSDLTSFPRAAFRDRLAAFVLDVILVVLAYQILDVFRRDNTVFLLLLAYFIGFWTWKGATVGGIICQLRVVRVDGAPLRFADALVRGLSSIFSLAVLGIGCLWMLRDPERQTWHDRIAGTYVVKVPRNWPL
ncbi:MAG: RDD family protein [Vicinamibacterales bacterium]